LLALAACVVLAHVAFGNELRKPNLVSMRFAALRDQVFAKQIGIDTVETDNADLNAGGPDGTRVLVNGVAQANEAKRLARPAHWAKNMERRYLPQQQYDEPEYRDTDRGAGAHNGPLTVINNVDFTPPPVVPKPPPAPVVVAPAPQVAPPPPVNGPAPPPPPPTPQPQSTPPVPPPPIIIPPTPPPLPKVPSVVSPQGVVTPKKIYTPVPNPVVVPNPIPPEARALPIKDAAQSLSGAQVAGNIQVPSLPIGQKGLRPDVQSSPSAAATAGPGLPSCVGGCWPAQPAPCSCGSHKCDGPCNAESYTAETVIDTVGVFKFHPKDLEPLEKDIKKLKIDLTLHKKALAALVSGPALKVKG
jgi:hypothetical protein